METIAEKFNGLAKKLAGHWKSCVENNNDSLRVLAEMYSNPVRFVYEIIQNAEDAGAKNICFHLNDVAVRIVHDGREFDFEDVKSITAAGFSNKDGVNTIGKFGVGFKSVFAVSDCPEIHSGDFHFRIENYIVPSRVSPEYGKGTAITLPLKQQSKSGELRQKIAEQLRGLRADALLFLSNIKRLEWRDGEEFGHCEREPNPLCEKEDLHCIEVILQTGANDAPSQEKYRLFRRKITIDEESVWVECAYLLNEAGAIAPTGNDTPLAVYFPTNEKPRLNFRLQIPCRTTPNRESVDFTLTENHQLTEAAAMLVADSLPMLRDNNLLTTDFITKVLPLDEKEGEGNEIYRAVFCAVKSKFLSGEKLLPRIGGEFATAKEAILGDSDLRDLLNSAQTKQLFGNNEWLNFPANATAYLRSQLGIPRKDYRDFVEQLNENFLQSQSDKWMAHFYGQLPDRWNSWDMRGTVANALRGKPFIRLENGDHDAPRSDEIYLPAESETGFKTVKPCFLEDKKAARFFRETLSLKNPGKVAEVKKFIVPRYHKGDEISNNQHIADMRTILLAEKENHSNTCDAIRNCPIIKTRAGAYRKISECYFADETLECWFAGNDTVGFVDTEFYGSALPPEWNETLGKLGISRTVKTENDEIHSVCQSYGRHEMGVRNFNPNFSIDGFEFALRNINPERSRLAWDFTLEYIHHLEGKIRTSANRAYLLRAEPEGRISKAGKLFRKHDWLFDKNDELIPRTSYGEITLRDLPACYRRDNEYAARTLAKFLGLKSDAIQQAEEENPGGKFLSADQFCEYEKLKQAEESRRHAAESDWQSNADADEIKPKKAQPTPSVGERQKGNATNDQAESSSDNGESSERDSPSSKHLKQIGKWAERYARKYLREEYPEKDGYSVIWENENGEQNPGCDFRVMRGSETICYAEVKGKIGSQPVYADVSRAQWEAAKKHGNKYLLIVVSDAGEESAAHFIIKNPAQQFRDGEIEASPVRIRI